MGSFSGALLVALAAATACGDSTHAGDGPGPDGGRAPKPSHALPVERDGGSACEAIAYRDRDADGWGDSQDSVTCADGELPEGFVLLSSDCDDSDPQAQRAAYRDADGDGQGDGELIRCYAHGGAPPEGFVTDGRDCDDTDPARLAYGFERWDDGVDQDCDGTDNVSSLECTCEFLLAAPPLAIDSLCPARDGFFGVEGPVRADEVAQAIDPRGVVGDCTGAADLRFAYVVRCPNCSLDLLHVVVENTGGAAAEGARLAIRPLRTDPGTEAALELGRLGPGERTTLISLPATREGRVELLVETVSDDCNPDNDLLATDIYRYECGFL